MLQKPLLPESATSAITPFKTQLLKWVGNKQRFAHEIISYFPEKFDTYYEPFIGSGAVLATLSPNSAVASDIFLPLVEIWNALTEDPEVLKDWYAKRWEQVMLGDKKVGYEKIKASYNKNPNGADLLFLCRSCYGGVVRFRQSDGYMSTPCGVHSPISPESFNTRVELWHKRFKKTKIVHCDFETIMKTAKKGDLVYCDPPYTDTQSILYGAHKFSLERLIETIKSCKRKGVRVALSIDGSKKSGSKKCHISFPGGIFESEVLVNCGRSMLRRFQMSGESLESEVVADRLLLTY
ncbi:MAG: DNA adenine methylase [Oligoflexales bacterium]